MQLNACRALLGNVKAQEKINFIYEPPSGLARHREECNKRKNEQRFELQRKYNAPREACVS